jgi:hypothetical protein
MPANISKSELENFIRSRKGQVGWFVTNAGLFKGKIWFIENENEDEITLQIQDCKFTADKTEHVGSFYFKLDGILGWAVEV